MRVARFRAGDRVAAGVVDGDEVVDLGVPDVVAALEAGVPDGPPPGAARYPLAEVRLLAPVARPPKFFGMALNFADHLAETNAVRPEFPRFFNKQSTCVIGPGDAIRRPRVSTELDYEGELGIVIGRRCRHVAAERAGEVIAGYTVVNDVSVRDWQRWSPTMTLGKSFDSHGPMGPWLVTTDGVPDPQALRIRTWVNGDLRQDGHTSEMLWTCFEQVEVLSTVCTLEAGDVVATGTPAGVGAWRDPPLWLVPGDVVRIEIDAIGVLQNPVVDET